MNLIIVESPTKSKTLKRFLGQDYEIAATMGHIRDLPKKKIGIDIEKNFSPNYKILPGRKKTIKKLKDLGKKSEEVFLGMDPDREGEAIAWHVSKALDLKEPKRIVFHEITESAIKSALDSPGKIDMKLVDAQQARRILDRLVGYKLSPFLWRKVVRGLSAGRVQSVVVRLIVERERERENFVPQEYWKIKALLGKIEAKEDSNEFEALLIRQGKKKIAKMTLKKKGEVENIVEEVENARYKIEKIKKKERKRNPYPPFKTSTLQQEAGKRFHFPSKFTMSLAQNLYERGLITYHRSDSLNLSKQSLLQAKDFIIKNYGNDYWIGFLRSYKTKSKSAQEAHEAIRPTDPDKTPSLVEKELETKSKKQERLKRAQLKLYGLIWKRFIASQMKPAVFDAVRANIRAEPETGKSFPSGVLHYTFKATGKTLKFDGFLKVYSLKIREKSLPKLEDGEQLNLKKIVPSQHFTQPPPRYSEARLIKALEGNGIGRPSTYAPIISTVQQRNYVKKDDQRKFYPTEIGTVVNDLLVEHFPEVVDVEFTAEMEEELDEIAEGKKEWTKVVEDFYKPFQKRLKKKEKEVPHKKETYKETKKKCPLCGGQLVIKLGKYGKFYACSNFPKCKHTESLEKNNLGITCPKCQKGEIVKKRTKKGKIFYGCTKWPDCDFALWDEPVNKTCPQCGSLLVKAKKNILKCSKKACDYREKSIDSE